MAITDHDSLVAQKNAMSLAEEFGIRYITGVELNVTFQPKDGKSISLDFLGYGFDVGNMPMLEKLTMMREHREKRADMILDLVNKQFEKEGKPAFTNEDIGKIKDSVDGAFGRPHIAAYMVKKGTVGTVQEAFEKYLVKFNVAKYPLSLQDASRMVHGAGGKLVLAHPNDPNGTSLAGLSKDLEEQSQIVRESMLEWIDGVEVWHKRNDRATTTHYLEFTRRHNLLATGGSDCHQRPIVMGSVDVPEFVANQIYRK